MALPNSSVPAKMSEDEILDYIAWMPPLQRDFIRPPTCAQQRAFSKVPDGRLELMRIWNERAALKILRKQQKKERERKRLQNSTFRRQIGPEPSNLARSRGRHNITGGRIASEVHVVNAGNSSAPTFNAGNSSVPTESPREKTNPSYEEWREKRKRQDMESFTKKAEELRNLSNFRFSSANFSESPPRQADRKFHSTPKHGDRIPNRSFGRSSERSFGRESEGYDDRDIDIRQGYNTRSRCRSEGKEESFRPKRLFGYNRKVVSVDDRGYEAPEGEERRVRSKSTADPITPRKGEKERRYIKEKNSFSAEWKQDEKELRRFVKSFKKSGATSWAEYITGSTVYTYGYDDNDYEVDGWNRQLAEATGLDEAHYRTIYRRSDGDYDFRFENLDPEVFLEEECFDEEEWNKKLQKKDPAKEAGRRNETRSSCEESELLISTLNNDEENIIKDPDSIHESCTGCGQPVGCTCESDADMDTSEKSDPEDKNNPENTGNEMEVPPEDTMGKDDKGDGGNGKFSTMGVERSERMEVLQEAVEKSLCFSSPDHLAGSDDSVDMVVVDKDAETPKNYKQNDFPAIESLAGNPAEKTGNVRNDESDAGHPAENTGKVRNDESAAGNPADNTGSVRKNDQADCTIDESCELCGAESGCRCTVYGGQYNKSESESPEPAAKNVQEFNGRFFMSGSDKVGERAILRFEGWPELPRPDHVRTADPDIVDIESEGSEEADKRDEGFDDENVCFHHKFAENTAHADECLVQGRPCPLCPADCDGKPCVCNHLDKDSEGNTRTKHLGYEWTSGTVNYTNIRCTDKECEYAFLNHHNSFRRSNNPVKFSKDENAIDETNEEMLSGAFKWPYADQETNETAEEATEEAGEDGDDINDEEEAAINAVDTSSQERESPAGPEEVSPMDQIEADDYPADNTQYDTSLSASTSSAGAYRGELSVTEPKHHSKELPDNETIKAKTEDFTRVRGQIEDWIKTHDVTKRGLVDEQICVLCTKHLIPQEEAEAQEPVCRIGDEDDCQHDFHEMCLRKWIYTMDEIRSQVPTCPTCREGITILAVYIE